MTTLQLSIHLLNFIAPSVFLALLLPLFSKFISSKKPLALGYYGKFAIIFVVCLLLQLAGLWLFGRDGKLVTYGLMVLAAGACLWSFGRGWK